MRGKARTYRVLVYGDGPHELLHEWNELLAHGDLPALACLVDRLIDGRGHIQYEMRLFRQSRHTRGKGLGNEKKTITAMFAAKQLGFDGMVILIDRDRKPRSETSDALVRGRDAVGPAGCPCAVGAAVEAFDAWMIIDGRAVQQAGGENARCHGDPEKLQGKEGTGQHPKDWAASLFGSKRGLGQKYAIIARHVDLDMLKKRCPEGFEPFAREVEQQIRPLFATS